ncbi:hypothetical protein MMC34_005952 [Xylographa carneopallida]|nr:hypothetical protein [Xylographa carneopallida]
MKFASGEWNGLNVQQLATGSHGHFYAKDLLRGTSQWNLPPQSGTDLNCLLAPRLNSIREVEFLAISPVSGFVVLYTNRNVTYTAIASPCFQKMLPTLAVGIWAIKTITFGFKDSILVTFENGGWFLDRTDLDPALEQKLVKRDSEGFVLRGRDSVLCQ